MASGDRPNTARKPPGKKTGKLSQKEQSERFKEAARELEADESGAAFDRAVKIIIPSKTT
ncbi:hypothetical protein [Mesorhizobium sp. LjNodule214]|uniref:hypothetical protein n=1 Tax=Mesorhizobium sp. LjNodule214 TaxID=3342252 RepID=UPI003ED07FFF